VSELPGSEVSGTVVTDVVVIGAGPAGLAAAVTAADAGARVVLLDAEVRPGGQYWRTGPGGPGTHHPDAGTWADLAVRLAAHEASGALDRRSRHRVWRLDALPGAPAAGRPGAAVVVHGVDVAPDGTETPVTLTARAVVVATGAHDRVLPFPGWDLPGVLTPGAVQALLKEHGVVAGERVVVAGSGPFLLPVAAALVRAGVRVPALLEAATAPALATGWLSAIRALPVLADRAGEGARYLADLARHGVRPRTGHAVVAAHGTGRVEAVTVARLDRSGAEVPGSSRRVACDAVAVGWGFTARAELALAAGAVAVAGPDGGTAVAADPCGRTAVPGLLVAGELLGIGGAGLALLTGELAGAAAAALALSGAAPDGAPHLLGRRRELGVFARALHRAHPVPPGWTARLDGDTVVCRCEEVTVADLNEAVDDLGAADARTAKLLTRAGMGWCQGRVCGEAVAALVAARSGVPAPVPVPVPRPVAVPLTLGALAGTDPPTRPGGTR